MLVRFADESMALLASAAKNGKIKIDEYDGRSLKGLLARRLLTKDGKITKDGRVVNSAMKILQRNGN